MEAKHFYVLVFSWFMVHDNQYVFVQFTSGRRVYLSVN